MSVKIWGFVGVGLMLSACATISQSECVAGNWSDLGYRDGVNGRARDRLADYVQKCGEYNAPVDRQAYLASFETGLTHYCTYDKGFARGREGSSYNSVCQGQAALDFRAGYEDGYREYELRQRYKKFTRDIEDAEAALADVKGRILDPAIAADEKDRLLKKKKRLDRELEELRWDFRRFKHKYDLDW